MTNRLRIVYLNEDLIVRVLNWSQSPYGSSLSLPVTCGLPEDSIVERVWSCPERRAIVALVSHPTFDECEPGRMPPEHGHPIAMNVISKYDAEAEGPMGHVSPSGSLGDGWPT